MRRAAAHPLLAEQPDLDPVALVIAVAADGGVNAPELLARQRAEWRALFEWCAREGMRDEG